MKAKTKLPNSQGAHSKEVPSTSISAPNMEIAAVLQPSAAGVKVVMGTYLKISAEEQAEIGQCVAEKIVSTKFSKTALCENLDP